MVLIRRLFRENTTLYSTLEASLKANARSALMERLTADNSSDVQKKIAQVIAEIAKNSTKQNSDDSSSDDGWPTLVGNLTQLCQSGNPQGQVAALTVLNYLAEFDGTRVVPFGKEFCMIVAPLMNETCEFKTRAAALKAACSLLIGKTTIESEFEELIPAMMGVISSALAAKEEVIAQDAFKQLIEVLEDHPRFMKNHMGSLTEFVVNHIAPNTEIEEDTKSLALEIMITVIEKAQVEVRKSPKMVENLVKTGMQIIAGGIFLKTIETSNAENEDFFDDEEDFRRAGEDLIMRISKTAGNKLMLPIAFQLIEQFLAENNWKSRTAGLITIGLVSQKGGVLFFQKAAHVMEIITRFVAPSNASVERVVFTAVNCLATIFYSLQELDYESKMKAALGEQSIALEDLEEEEEEAVLQQFAASLCNPVFQSLAALLNSDQFSWKIKQEACSTLLAVFAAIDDKEIVRPFEENLLTGIFNVVKASPENLFAVKVEGLTAVSSLAQVLQKDFGKYYDHFMPIAKELIRICAQNQKDLPENCESMRGKAMDCVGLLGAAVDASKFEPDARFVMDMLINSASNSGSVYDFGKADFDDMDDEETLQEVREYVVRASCRICTTMGHSGRFYEYLKFLIPPLLKMADAKVDLNVFDADEVPEEDSKMRQVELNVRGVGEKKIEFNTFAMQDKELAMNMIFAYADIFQQYFMPWSLKALKTAIPELLSPMYNVRLASSYTAPKALLALAKATYLIKGMKSPFESTDESGKLITDEQFNEKREKFAAFLKTANVSEADLAGINEGLLQDVFDEIVHGLLESLQLSLEEDDEFVNEDIDLFDEEDDDEEMILVAAESLASTLRLSFESSGLTDSLTDKLLSDEYEAQRSSFRPLFHIATENLSETVSTMLEIMKKRVAKRVRMVNFMANLGDEVDAQMEDALEASDRRMNDFLDSMSEAVGCIIKAHSCVDRPALLHTFKHFCHPFASELLNHQEDATVVAQLKAVGLFFYDDLLDFFGNDAAEYVSFCVPHMLNLSNHENYLVRQAACFGIGVCAEKAATQFSQFGLKSVNVLKTVVTAPKAQTGSHTSATDNAVSSMMKIIATQSQILSHNGVDPLKLYGELLTVLPMKTDVIEAKLVHYKLAKHAIVQDEIFKAFGERIKEILIKALKSKKGLDKETGEYDVNNAILTHNTRMWLMEQHFK